MATSEEIAWAAGLFEGEGSIEIWRQSPYHHSYLRAAISSTDADVLQRFVDIVGNSQKVLGPYTRAKHPHHKPMWRVVLVGKSAVAAFDEMSPYFGERRLARLNEVLALLAERSADAGVMTNA